MSRRLRLRDVLRDPSGATAIEYALCLPLLVTMIMGAIWVGLLMFAVSSMDSAVQTAARCASVNANQCGSLYAVEQYAQSRYVGPAISPDFEATTAGCGHTVTGQAQFNINLVPGIGSVPISVSACYP